MKRTRSKKSRDTVPLSRPRPLLPLIKATPSHTKTEERLGKREGSIIVVVFSIGTLRAGADLDDNKKAWTS
jgi:hypothetical protein